MQFFLTRILLNQDRSDSTSAYREHAKQTSMQCLKKIKQQTIQWEAKLQQHSSSHAEWEHAHSHTNGWGGTFFWGSSEKEINRQPGWARGLDVTKAQLKDKKGTFPSPRPIAVKWNGNNDTYRQHPAARQTNRGGGRSERHISAAAADTVSSAFKGCKSGQIWLLQPSLSLPHTLSSQRLHSHIYLH